MKIQPNLILFAAFLVTMLCAHGAAPEIAVFNGDSTNVVDERVDNVGTNLFADTLVGSSATQTFTIKNVGTANLTGIGVTGTGSNGTDFPFTTPDNTTLAPGEVTTFTTTFKPTATEDRNFVVSISSNDSDENLFEIRLAGKALSPEISVEGPPGVLLVSRQVVGWGRNSNGQITVPDDLIAARLIAAGGSHTLAFKEDDTIVGWGDNFFGQVNAPTNLTNVVTIKAGLSYSLALQSNGSVVAWGNNVFGQTNVPSDLTNVQAISAGDNHVVALKRDGTVIAWGRNNNLQTNVPVGLTGVVAIAAGGEHNLALKGDGSVVSWGRNISTPIGLTGVCSVAAALNHALALKSNGTVIAWGDNSAGQTNVPLSLSNVQAIAAGNFFSVALQSNSTVAAWGRNTFGQIAVPSGLTNVFAISASVSHTMALTDFAVAFGTQTVASTSAARTFTIKNTGNHPLHITNVTAVGGEASDFTVDIAGMLTTVPTNDQTTFTATFTPSFVGTRRTTLRVVNDDTDENPFYIVLTGTGTVSFNPPQIHVASLKTLGNGEFQFTFSNANDLTYSVLASTNIALPLTNWNVLGIATNLGGGFSQFTDVGTNSPQRFYQLRFP